jgi:hypothetical protein
MLSDNEFNSLNLTSTFTNGSQIPDGSFRVLLRALRVTGDPTQEKDYDSFLSPVLDITNMNRTTA